MRKRTSGGPSGSRGIRTGGGSSGSRGIKNGGGPSGSDQCRRLFTTLVDEGGSPSSVIIPCTGGHLFTAALASGSPCTVMKRPPDCSISWKAVQFTVSLPRIRRLYLTVLLHDQHRFRSKPVLASSSEPMTMAWQTSFCGERRVAFSHTGQTSPGKVYSR